MGDEVGAFKIHETTNGPVKIEANPKTPSLWVGQHKQVELLGEPDSAGGLRLRDSKGEAGVTLRGTSAGFHVHDPDGTEVAGFATANALLELGRSGKHGIAGRLALRDSAGSTSATFSGDSGGFTVNNSVRYEESDGDAILRLGSGGLNGVVHMRNAAGQETLTIDGGTGDITFAHADCAEDFDAYADVAEPGMLVVVDDSGRVSPCDQDYDDRVAGIVSGAGPYKPGLVLDRRPRTGAHATVALMGKVYCWVDADAAPIRVGTQITTSALRGHGRAVTDRARGIGAVVGKALAPLAAGRGLIPVLVALR